MKKRSIDIVVSPRVPHFVGDGFRVQNFIPSAYGLDMKAMDPFIFLDYNAPFYFEATSTPRGVDVHPHRGFETVTVAFKGKVAHHDSAGNSGVVEEGGVQWMTAASGVLHKEYHEKEFAAKGGLFSMAQLWVNLPAKNKMDAPKYQGFSKEDIPEVIVSDGVVVKIIAGQFAATQGPAYTHSPIELYRIELDADRMIDLSFNKSYNTGVLVVEGSIHINDGDVIDVDHFIRMANDAENFTIKATSKVTLLVLSGKPLDEPIAAQGPFVMNTREELMQAMKDFYEGKFGQLD